MKIKLPFKYVWTLLLIYSFQLSAENHGPEFEFNGFISAQYHLSDNDAEYNHGEEQGLEATRAGLNARVDINERFRVIGQAFVIKHENDSSAHIDWLYTEFEFSENFDIRVGKITLPIGLASEYQDVSFAYPWLNTPASFYSDAEAPRGPQLARDSYEGASLVWKQNIDDWELSVDLFGGDLDLDQMLSKNVTGFSLEADWEQIYLIELTRYQGTMRQVMIPTDPILAASMEGQQHTAWAAGFQLEQLNWLVMLEKGRVEMSDIPAMTTDTWYVTAGYRVGSLLPHVTFESFRRGRPNWNDQDTLTLGLRWDLMDKVALKFELSQIRLNQGNGLFLTRPDSSKINILGFGVDMVF